jgi:hypothetical protein
VVPLLDEPTPRASDVVLALTPRLAVVATRGPGGGSSYGAGSLWNIDRAKNRTTRIPVDGAEGAVRRGDDVWILLGSIGNMRFHRVEAGEHDARSWRDFSIGYSVTDIVTVRDDGVFLLAQSAPFTEEGTPYGWLIAVDRSGVLASTGLARGHKDGPYFGVVPRGRSTLVLRRGFGRSCRDEAASLLSLGPRLDVGREIRVPSFDDCRRCQPLVQLGSDMATGCDDGALIVMDDAGHAHETALGRRIEAIGALDHQLVVVSEAGTPPSGDEYEADIESPPGTPIASFRYRYTPNIGVAFPVVATSGNEALVAWASLDARDTWYVHARLLTCR